MFEINCYDSYGDSINFLTQWDINRKLIMYIDDYDLSIAPEIHFANKKSEEALVVQSSVSDGNKVAVDIPNILLQEPYPLFIHVYLTDSNDTSSQKTIISIEIPVRKRTKPSEYVYDDNTLDVLEAKIAEWNQTIANLQKRVKELEDQAVDFKNRIEELENQTVLEIVE